ncbi:MAG: hypothetical protein R2698_04400 [Microthrixaceae bacterium]
MPPSAKIDAIVACVAIASIALVDRTTSWGVMMAEIGDPDPLAAAGPPAPAGAVPTAVPFQIVPLRGLPFAAAALVLVVYAIASGSKWALMLCHVAGGGLWTAVDLYVGLVLGPIIGRLSPPARAEFTVRFMPKMVVLMPTLVMMTLAAGFQIGIDYGNLLQGTVNQPWLVASMVVVGIMAIIALGILEPANIAVLFEMRKPSPDFEVVEHLMKRFVATAGITGLMQVATLLIMTRVATQ